MLRQVLAFAVSLSLSLSAAAAEVKSLAEELYALDQMRNFDKTSFSEVEAVGKDLLRRYPSDADQALIFFTVAEVFAQSGQLHPHKTAEYSQLALSKSPDPVRELKLYTYWGDSVQVQHKGSKHAALATARRQAAVPYLNGLKRSLELDLPTVAPAIPDVPPVPTSAGDEGDAKRQAYAAAVAARERAMMARELVAHRDVIKGQVAYMYSRYPFDTTELERLVSDSLKDSELGAELIREVKSTIQARVSAQYKADHTLEARVRSFGNGDANPASSATVPVNRSTEQARAVPQIDIPQPAVSPADAGRGNKNWLVLVGIVVVALTCCAVWLCRQMRRSIENS